VSEEEEDDEENFALRPQRPIGAKRPKISFRDIIESHEALIKSNNQLHDDNRQLRDQVVTLKNAVESLLSNHQFIIQQFSSFKADVKMVLDNSLSSAVADRKNSQALEQIHGMITRR